jgi:PadR family transcriptional regulator PadR
MRNRGRKGWGRGRAARMLTPVLLLLLRRGDAHGYTLLEKLADFGFPPGSVDPSVVYRALRSMEEDGLVVSYQGDYSQGPPRRVYRITNAGEAALSIMADDLAHTAEMIEKFLKEYRPQGSG